jgi:hypothetical protein
MPFTKFTDLDFSQIRESIKDYLRANSNFTDFDFEGSNFSVLIDVLAYNTYINSFNANMIANESFLDSATLRENVVSLARNIGYVPRSRTSSKANVSFSVLVNSDTPTLTLKAGLVCVGNESNSSYTFSIPEDITTTTTLIGGGPTEEVGERIAEFNEIDIYQGVFLTKRFTVDNSIKQKFILDNSFIDTSTIKVYISGPGESGRGTEYFQVENIINVNNNSLIYLVQEIKDEKYELIFGDGIFGRKLENGSVITVNYIVTDGTSGNGVSSFSFSGTFSGAYDNLITPIETVIPFTIQRSIGGSEIENIDSIKYFSPRLYSAQYRAVTARDYETIIKRIYPETESVSVVGGEELDPPEFGSVNISIKPKNSTYLSDFTKSNILSQLKNYSLTGINQKIVDLKILYVEIDSSIYYNSSQVSVSDDLRTTIIKTLNTYASSMGANKFGGRFKYSKLLNIIDKVDTSITSNITKVRMRRDLKCVQNRFAQYEICFGNEFHIKNEGYNIKSTGFTIEGDTETVFFTDVPNPDKKTGILSIVKRLDNSSSIRVVVKSAGTIDYAKGEILINTIKITSTDIPDNIVQIQAFPESNDVLAFKDLYLIFDVSNSTINMVKDTISSGEKISGVGFPVISSYPNGKLTR